MTQDNSLKPQTLRGFNDWFASDVKLSRLSSIHLNPFLKNTAMNH